MGVGKEILQIEFFMPDGSIRKYVVGEEFDRKTNTGIHSYDGFVRISLFGAIDETAYSGRTFSTFISMPTSIPHSMEYLEVRPWYGKPQSPGAR